MRQADLRHGDGVMIPFAGTHTYQLLSGMPIDPERLAWGRTVHALRAMTEIATWEHQDRTDAYSGHPWMAMRSVLEAQLATVTD